MFATLEGTIDQTLERRREARRCRVRAICEQQARLAQQLTEVVREAEDDGDWQVAGCYALPIAANRAAPGVVEGRHPRRVHPPRTALSVDQNRDESVDAETNGQNLHDPAEPDLVLAAADQHETEPGVTHPAEQADHQLNHSAREDGESQHAERRQDVHTSSVIAARVLLGTPCGARDADEQPYQQPDDA